MKFLRWYKKNFWRMYWRNLKATVLGYGIIFTALMVYGYIVQRRDQKPLFGAMDPDLEVLLDEEDELQRHKDRMNQIQQNYRNRK